MKFPDSPFWNYSSQLFQIAEVADACLQLQNNFDADVNLLLFCCWAGDNHQQLNDADIAALIEACEPWQSTIIKPLREARKLLKNQIIAMPAHLHNQTLNNLSEMEINAEHMAQLNMEKTIDLNTRTCSEASTVDISARNLLSYAQSLEKSRVSDISGHITSLLKHVYGNDEMVQTAMMMAMS